MKSFRSLLASGLMTALLTPAAQTANARDYSTESAKGKVAVSSHLLEQLDNSALRTRSAGATEESVMADLVLNSTTGLEQALTALGVKVLLISDKYQRASVRLSSSEQAAAVAALPQVTRVNAEYGAVKRAGSVTSRAAVAMNAQLLSSLPAGLTGAGEKVGILSDSFANTPSVRDSGTTPALCQSGILRNAINQDSGDLPDEIDLRSDNLGGCSQGTDEGAAMAELVHDIAPGAEIAFSSVGGSQLAFANAIDDLCAPESSGGAGATVVVDDIIFFAQLLYQNDIVAQAARDCVASGVPYFSAAGNEGDAAISATYTDVSPSVRSSGASLDDAHAWSTNDRYMAVTIPNGEQLSAVLHWNQPAAEADVDLDLFLLNSESALSDSTVVTLSAEAQDGSSGSAPPVEIIQYTNNTGSSQTLYLVVDQYNSDDNVTFNAPVTTIPQSGSEPLVFRLSFYRSSSAITFEYPFNASTMYGHTNAPGVMAVAAVPWFDTESFDPGFSPTAETDPENFTARGGEALERQFDDNGNFVKETYQAPALAAVDGNNTTFFGSDVDLGNAFSEPDGFPNFFGTSAAAPNAAAIAALLLEAGSDAVTPAVLADIMTSTATDIIGARAAAGWDDVTGAGLIDGHAAYQELLARGLEDDGSTDGEEDSGDDSSDGTVDDSNQDDTPDVFSGGGSGSGSFSLWLLLLTPVLVLLRQRKRA